MKKLLLVLASIAAALIFFLLWKDAALKEKTENTSPATTVPAAAQSTTISHNAQRNVSDAPVQIGAYGGSFSKAKTPGSDPSAIREQQAADLRYLESIVALDVRDGINQEVREREKQMRNVADTFWVGMPARQSMELLGEPSVIHTNIAHNWITTEEDARRVGHQQHILGFDFYYSPREGLKLDGHNGAGHQDLLLRVSTNDQLVSWQWHRPRPFMSGEDGLWSKRR